MKVRKNYTAVLKVPFLVLLTICSVALLFSSDGRAQQNAGKIPIKDLTSFGKPLRKNLSNGGYTLIYKNKQGQTIYREEYNGLDVKVKATDVNAVYPNGQEASVKIKYMGFSGGEAGVLVKQEKIDYDGKGKIIQSETLKDYIDVLEGAVYARFPLTKIETKNGGTKTYKRTLDSPDWEDYLETSIQPPPLPSREAFPPSPIDACLWGTWEATGVKTSNSFITGGGTGFRVTFKQDGTQIVDYSSMKPFQAGNDSIAYVGTATARMSTRDGVAKIEKIENQGVTMKTVSVAGNFEIKLMSLGPGGLGSSLNNNSYTCTTDSLSYQTSTSRDGRANATVTLVRLKK